MKQTKEYKIDGLDDTNGSPCAITVKADDPDSAVAAALRRGVIASEFESEDGESFVLRGGQVIRVRSEDETLDVHALVLTAFAPPLGLLIGAVRLANGERSGLPFVYLSIIESLVWFFVLTR